MKRDIDLIRRILTEVEANDGTSVWSTSNPLAAYNVGLMHDADLVDARVISNSQGLPAQAAILKITWEGHDFLDAAKDDTIWNTVKAKVLAPGVSWTVSIFMDYLKLEAKKKLGLI